MPVTPLATLRIRVLLFGSYAEALSFDQLELSLEHASSVGDAVERLRLLPGGDRLPRRPLCALNLSQAKLDQPLAPGDELAILPPLAGG
jgi:molybdopterin converting factor small subunit